MRCVVGLSGGVDSATSAYLMKKRGYEVIGCTLKLFDNEKSAASINDAQEVAKFLGVPVEIVDCSADFSKCVIEKFIEYYKCGKTPSPCVICNEFIKFKYLNDIRRKYNADLLVTGHYAQIKRPGNAGKTSIELHQAIAKDRDQSYFLYAVGSEVLSFAEFPLGNFASKADVRKLACEIGIKVAEKSDSQDICFIPNNDHMEFLKNRERKGCCNCNNFHDNAAGGVIRDTSGKILGYHKGIVNYTIGQRKGLGLSGGPFFVSHIDVAKNEIVVASKEEIRVQKLQLKNVKFIGAPFEGLCQVKIRSCGAKIAAKISSKNAVDNRKNFDVEMLEREYGAAPGQHCVFYEDTKVLGGGEIVYSL